MKPLVLATAILLTASSTAFGKCKLQTGPTPTLPDPEVATLEEMLTARQAVATYIEAGTEFIRCAELRGDNRAHRVIRKMKRVAKKFQNANHHFSERVAKNSELLNNSDQVASQTH